MSDIEDRLEIMDLLARYGAGLDARDWLLWRSVFTDRALFDLSSWSDETPQRVETDRVVKVQSRLFAEFDVTQHLISNFRITLDGDSARVIAVMRAEHWIRIAPESAATKRYTMFGYYDDRLLRIGDQWKIDEMHLEVTNTEGDRWVIEEATRRARARRRGQ